jgi:hypothetical protein
MITRDSNLWLLLVFIATVLAHLCPVRASVALWSFVLLGSSFFKKKIATGLHNPRRQSQQNVH